MAKSKLKKTSSFRGASRPVYVPVLRLSLGWAIGLMGGCVGVVALSHSLRQMVFGLAICGGIAVCLSTITRRDHYALRRKLLGFKTKAFCRKTKAWQGATVSSLSRSSLIPRRGDPIVRSH